MENVTLQLKDPSATFSDSGQTLNFRDTLSFPKTEKVRTALKTGIVRSVRDENLEKVQPTDVETLEVGEEKDVKPSKRK